MSVSVGAFSSKSRLITAANWSSVWKTGKSSAGKNLKGETIRPYRLMTNGFMWAPSNRIAPGYDLMTDGILRQGAWEQQVCSPAARSLHLEQAGIMTLCPS